MERIELSIVLKCWNRNLKWLNCIFSGFSVVLIFFSKPSPIDDAKLVVKSIAVLDTALSRCVQNGKNEFLKKTWVYATLT